MTIKGAYGKKSGKKKQKGDEGKKKRKRKKRSTGEVDHRKN